MSEWGPWIEHDGKGCPCVGEYIHAVSHTGMERLGIVRGPGKSWDWRNYPRYSKLVRYRIRKPKGLIICEEILRNLPVTEDA